MTTAHTPAQALVLNVVDRNGSSMIASRTVPAENTVHVSAARALVRAGILEEYAGPDGAFVRRVPPQAQADA